MKQILTLLAVTLIGAGTARAENVRELLQRASATPRAGIVKIKASGVETKFHAVTDKEYVAVRDSIVAMGQSAVPELQAVVAAPASSWQERIMAGICLERIQRGDEIRAFVNYNWRNDPALRDEPDWNTRLGFPRKFFAVSEARLLATGLKYYWLELLWKRISEHPRLDGGRWHLRGASALEGTNDSDLVHVARERVQEIQDPMEIVGDGEWYYHYLLRVKDHESLSLLFDIWLRYREQDWPQSLKMYLRYHPGEEDRCREYATQSSTALLPGLLAIAKPDDAGWITQKLQSIPLGTDAQKALDTYLASVGDKTAPAITILGVNPGTIECGGVYTDAGATATDNKDGDITARIVVENNVDTPKVGTYQVTYRVADAAGNAATATRTVKVVYKFDGFLAPIGGADATGGNYANPVRTFKLGSTIPVKFQISCGGTAVKAGVHTLQVIKYNNATTAAEPIDATPTDAATTGNQFKLTGDEWHFNLDTKATGMSVGTWQLKATLSDGSTHTVWVAVK
jgi:hypothetical protein